MARGQRHSVIRIDLKNIKIHVLIEGCASTSILFLCMVRYMQDKKWYGKKLMEAETINFMVFNLKQIGKIKIYKKT